HLFQLLAMTAMEAPTSFAAEAVRDEKTKVLHAIRPLTPEEVLGATVRGQYGAGRIAEQSLPGYRQSPQVSATSNTETYVALRLTIDSWRWAGVPFYLRTGKGLAGHTTEIVIQFKQAPLALFRETAVAQLGANQLVLHIQPDEGISLRFIAKVPGIRVRTSDVKMNFAYQDYFAETPFTGYATLLYDALQGDATLFQRADFVAAGWSVVQPILDVWQSLPPRDFPNYSAGSWGPAAADELLARDGRCWRSPQS
ncbi:MAG: glucose-6-phosphate dehydrogenase (NADP(+)), partial [Planctomycetaceae bacterium]|nr:glucose-6-phosphate dehydrogenase (NADP(+)) [Planctomycetaceae bacterium]